MRPRNQVARDQLAVLLARRAPASASTLATELGISGATMHRLLQDVGGPLIAAGRARRTRYALRRPVRGQQADLPVYAVDVKGRAELLASLAPIQPRGTWMDLSGTDRPVPEAARDGWWEGLPYPLYDMHPQGYLGRQFARAAQGPLGVSDNPQQWSDDDVLHVLSQWGSDMSGDLIVGDPAYERWMQAKMASLEPLTPAATGRAYLQLAEQAISAGVAGSSAAGEFPKFAALRELAGSATPHVLVKFSGAGDSPAVRRWADLLVCEHLALTCAATLPGVEAARSRIVRHGGRTFFETERFDRHGLHGRSRLNSLSVIDAAFMGSGTSDWTQLADRLAALGLLAPADVQHIRHLWWFGRLIANTDMHLGNLSFGAQGGELGFRLAPAYDMLPMLHAPLPGGELSAREFAPPLPLPPQRPVWLAACEAALRFWDEAGRDARISAPFRAVCQTNARRLRDVAQQV